MHTSQEVHPQTHCLSCEGACPTVPSPLVGEGQEWGRTRTVSVSCSDPMNASQPPFASLWTKRASRSVFVATPLPVPPPQGGRERCGTTLPNSRQHPRICLQTYLFVDMCKRLRGDDSKRFFPRLRPTPSARAAWRSRPP